ncbi:AAA family ATPase [Rhizobium sp. 12,4]|uniref:phosphatase domain-containing protein n=1 Tax=Rhizobium sp. 12,4 TaxID=3405135 RepID=UPI003D33E552
MFVVFDLDGTLADISHRTPFVRGQQRPDWDAFFAACIDDIPHLHVIETFKAHLDAGHKVRVWSARSDVVRIQTEDWLLRHGIDPCFLQHMRAAGDNTPDAVLKRHWLHQEEVRPDIVYDDRQRVVDMWRSEGIPCFQVVADWEDEGRKIAPVAETLLTVMVGPSGAGKSTWVKENVPSWQALSSDWLRFEYTGGIEDQSRNDDVFTALHRIAKARLDSGLPVCVDATNLRRRDRLACVALAPAGTRVRYVVIDRPLAEKKASAGWRETIEVQGKPLVEYHHERFQSALRDILAGDGLPNVHVIDLRTTITEVAA